jgi:mannose-1-phosphate guanylyltransferase
MRDPRHTWVVVLAGGSGSRLASLTTGADGISVPKQFFHFGGSRSMLEQTLDRARMFAPPERIIPVVLERHRAWWEPALAGIPEANRVVQLRNRGTGSALLCATVRMLGADRDGTILVLPSDHGVEDTARLRRSIEQLLDEAQESPDRLLMLGAEPDRAETSYGWIVPGDGPRGSAWSVSRFVEKPEVHEAERLLRDGALWNTFILSCSVRAMALLFARLHPHWLERALWRGAGDSSDSHSLARLYAELPDLDFARHVLSAAGNRLGVLPLPPCGWTDLGTPPRVREWMFRHEGVDVFALAGQRLPAGAHA